MAVTITSPVLGLAVGDPYSGDLEPWLLSEGYARNSATVDGAPNAAVAYADAFAVDPQNDNPTDYTGDITADGFNTLDAGGKADGVLAVDDPTDAANREAPKWPNASEAVNIANSAENLNELEFPNPDYDFDQGGVDDDAPTVLSVEPNEGPAAGGTEVTVTGSSFTDATGVTFDGVAGTAFVLVSDTEITVTTPAGTAGPADVVVTDSVGSDTLVGGFTYTA